MFKNNLDFQMRDFHVYFAFSVQKFTFYVLLFSLSISFVVDGFLLDTKLDIRSLVTVVRLSNSSKF